ncbi:hypothetical protein INR49_007275 [Caranx melampygus]|nr:hypothetical protein INR49_007275 [Caranx melampygus]
MWSTQRGVRRRRGGRDRSVVPEGKRPIQPIRGRGGADREQPRPGWSLTRGEHQPGDEVRTARPSDAAEEATTLQSVATATSPTSSTPDSTQQDRIRTSAPTEASPHWSSSKTTLPAPQPLMMSTGNPVEQKVPTVKPEASVSPEPTPAGAPPTSTTITSLQTRAMTSDPTTMSALSPTPPTRSPAPSPAATTVSEVTGSEVTESNRGPVADVGPDRKVLLPVSSLLLNGSGSTDDRGIVSFHWDAISGPPGLKLEDVDQAVAVATGLRAGRYTFRLTVSDQEGATDSASLTVRVQEGGRSLLRSLPPVAHASGSHTLTLPNNSLVLRGSVTDGDQTEVHFLWVRDRQSPAAGDVLYGSDTQASLYLANLVEGTYLFQLRVTDAQGRSSTATATVEVRPEPGGGEEVELEMLVSVSQVSLAQRDTVLRQLAALLHVLDGDIQVRALQGHSHLSTVLRFSVRGPSGPLSGSRLVVLLRNQLLREKSDYLLFRVLRVDTVCESLRPGPDPDQEQQFSLNSPPQSCEFSVFILQKGHTLTSV